MGDVGGCLLLVLVGFAAGTLNVVAGGGSFLTLPALIFLGLPPSLANGTNRVAILLQNVVATWSFRRHGLLEGRALLWGALPATLGAAVGASLALYLSDQAFQKILAFLMIFLSLASLWKPGREGVESIQVRWPWVWFGFFLVGVYGGFIQAGVGFLVLAITTATGLDLVRGNAIKVLSILCLTALSLAIFAWQGKVVWSQGLCLAVGTMLGGITGVKLTILKGHRWIRRVVTVVVILFAVKLWFTAA